MTGFGRCIECGTTLKAFRPVAPNPNTKRRELRLPPKEQRAQQGQQAPPQRPQQAPPQQLQQRVRRDSVQLRHAQLDQRPPTPRLKLAPTRDGRPLSQQVADRLWQWKAHLDNYDVKLNGESDPDLLIEQADLSIDKVFLMIARQELYKGAGAERSARLAFLDSFIERLSTRPMKDPGELRGKTVKLAKLIGKSNVALYKDAILEESNSIAFRDAVVLTGVKTYNNLGQDWTKPKHLFVGGSSGAGKTFGAKVIIKALIESAGDLSGSFYQNGQNRIPYFVSVDGGDARGVSQIRKLVLQAALVLGYMGIKDLHKNSSKLDIKDYIKAAAFHPSSRVHVVEPRTFTDRKVENYARLVHSRERVVFCMVETAPDVIQLQGDSRAWYDHGKVPQPKARYIQLNNDKVGCESKAYSSMGRSLGFARSETARALYIKDINTSEDIPIIVVLKNNSKVVNNKIDYSTPPDVEVSYAGITTKYGVWSDKTVVHQGFTMKKNKYDPFKRG